MYSKLFLYLCCFICISVILSGSSLFAQQGQGPVPGQGQGMRFPQMPPAPVVKIGNDGVYILSGQMLYKYTPVTLKFIDSIQLLEAPAPPPNDGNGGQMMFPRIITPSMMIAPDAGLVIVIAGDQFISVDAKSMKQKAKGTLPSIQPPGNRNAPGAQGGAPGAPPFGMMGFAFGPPVMELQGNTLYITRMDQLVAVDIMTGKVTASTALPKPDAPQ